MHPLKSTRFIRFLSPRDLIGRIGLTVARFGSIAALVMTIGVASSLDAAAKASVTNRDDKDHKITIVEGTTKQDHVLTPNQMLEGICVNGCILRLNDSEDDEYQLENNDVVSIEDGYLYYDTEQPADAAPDAKADDKAGKKQ